MTSRERLLAFLLLGLILLGVGGGLGYVFVYSPLQDKKAAGEKLDQEIADFGDKADAGRAAKMRYAAVRTRSLPADPNFARSAYHDLLTRLLADAGMTNFAISEGKVLDNRAPATPELAPKKPAYTRLEFRVSKVTGVTVWQVVDFLRAFYQTELLHQITYFSLTRTNKTEARNGLELGLTIEAVILDGAENRRTLLPPPAPTAVPNAVAAVAGVRGLQMVNQKYDLARKYPAPPKTGQAPPPPVLATAPRDYSFLAWKDMFYGVLPPYVPPKPAPLAVGKLADVTLSRDEKSGEVRVRLSGEGSVGAKVAATASGNLLPPGELKVDPKTYTIAIPGAGTDDTPDDAASTVSVVVTSADGAATAKGSFNVAVAKKPVVPPTPVGPDIAAAIKMPIFSGRSDGTYKATIFDAANPFKYEVTVDGKDIEVTKFRPPKEKKGRSVKDQWEKDPGYDEPPGVLVFADDFSDTKRRFKVIAFEDDALVLSESLRPAAKEAPKAGPTPKGGRPGSAPRQGPADPLAAVTGNPAVANPPPVVYRWSLGKSLKELEKLSPEEAKTIQKRVAAGGPVVAASAATRGD